MRSRLVVIYVIACSFLAVASVPVTAGVETGFSDVEDIDPMAGPVTWLRLSGTTKGCNPPLNTEFCPDQVVTRGQMAAMLSRTLELPAAPPHDRFVDDNGSVFEEAIERLAAVGITLGCNPPHNDHFCPTHAVTREQMAAFLARAYRLPDATGPDSFVDTAGSPFLSQINAIAAGGVTLGCNPPANDRFCPKRMVTRAELATFLWRAEDRPHPDGPTRLVAAGDIARCELDSDEMTAYLLDDLFATTNGVVAALGDTVYNEGSATQFDECYDPSWGRHRFRTRPTAGNHEYLTPGASGYYEYFGQAAGDPEQGWYSYELNGWQVVVLNSNCDEVGGCDSGSAQQQWLDATLAAAPGTCALAYMHHPRFSSGSHGDEERVAELWATLEEHGVELVLAGHDHHYERFAPMTHTGAPDAGGIRSFVVGTGGTWLRPADSSSRNGSELVIDDAHGVLSLDLDTDRYDWHFVDTSGHVLDAGTGPCN